jgi:hypothetical protein
MSELLLSIIRVLPLGAERDTTSAPMMPPAPLRFSIVKASHCPIRSAPPEYPDLWPLEGGMAWSEVPAGTQSAL